MSADWLVGSFYTATALGFDSGSARTVAAGSYYLKDATASISLLNAFSTALANDVTNTVTLTKAGKVRIVMNSSTSITWTSSTLRDLLGFTADITSQTSVTAANHSPLWWSAGYEATPEAPLNDQGQDVTDGIVTRSRSGLTSVFTKHNTAKVNGFSWPVVDATKVYTSARGSGEFKAFAERVLDRGQPFKLWREIDESSTSSAEATVGGVTTLGPYKTTAYLGQWYQRIVANAEIVSPVQVRCIKVNELSNT